MKNKIASFLILLFVLIGTSFPIASFAAIDCNQKGLSAADCARCNQLANQFTIDKSTINAGATGIDSNSIVGSLPSYCSGNQILLTAINILLAVSASIAILFIIIGGFWYLTSAGNEETIEKGRKTLTNALIGLVVIIMAGTIVRIALNALTGGLGGGGSGATNSNNGANTNSSSNGINVTSLKNIVSVNISQLAAMSPSGQVTITATFSTANESAVLQACGVQSVSAVSFSILDGNNKKIGAVGKFAQNYGNDAASVSISASQLSPKTGTVDAIVCDVSIASQSYVVANDFQSENNSGSQGTNQPAFNTQAVQDAASRSSFDTSWKDSSTLIVNLHMNDTDERIMCGNTPNVSSPIQLMLNGSLRAREAATVRQFPITIIGSNVPQVSITVCDTTVSGTQPTPFSGK